MRIKGFTVHQADANGKALCGATPKGFMGEAGLSTDPRRVTCPTCERKAKGLKRFEVLVLCSGGEETYRVWSKTESAAKFDACAKAEKDYPFAAAFRVISIQEIS